MTSPSGVAAMTKCGTSRLIFLQPNADDRISLSQNPFEGSNCICHRPILHGRKHGGYRIVVRAARGIRESAQADLDRWEMPCPAWTR
jgi:hypothetical protein